MTSCIVVYTQLVKPIAFAWGCGALVPRPARDAELAERAAFPSTTAAGPRS